MHGPHIEEQTVTDSTALALDIAKRLRKQPGKAVVVSEYPEAMASLVGKRWQQVLRSVQREYAATLDSHKRQQLDQTIASMRSRVFTAASKPELLETTKIGVLFCTAEALLRYAPPCHSMYVTYPIEHKTLHLISAWMQPEDSIVCYRMVSPAPKPTVTRQSVDYMVVYRAS